MKKRVALLIICITLILVACSCSAQAKAFKKAREDALEIAGQISGEKDHFTIDTKESRVPFDEMTALQKQMHFKMEAQALEAIEHTNNLLGFDSGLYDLMMETSESDGKQFRENSNYSVTWEYAYNDGLKVTYKLK